MFDANRLRRMLIGHMDYGDVGVIYPDGQPTYFIKCRDADRQNAVLHLGGNYAPTAFPIRQHVLAIGRAELRVDVAVSREATEAEVGDLLLTDSFAIVGHDADHRETFATYLDGRCEIVEVRVGFRVYPNWELGVREGDRFVMIERHFRPQ